MAEHASLRVYFRNFRELNSDLIFELDGFIVNCHAKVEDDVVFPTIRRLVGSDSQVVKAIDQLEDDHRVIQMLSNTMRAAVAEEKGEIDRKKIALYADTVAPHNSAEEISVFQSWRKVDRLQEEGAVQRVRSIINTFGLDKYFRVTGFSKEFLDSVA